MRYPCTLRFIKKIVFACTGKNSQSFFGNHIVNIITVAYTGGIDYICSLNIAFAVWIFHEFSLSIPVTSASSMISRSVSDGSFCHCKAVFPKDSRLLPLAHTERRQLHRKYSAQASKFIFSDYLNVLNSVFDTPFDKSSSIVLPLPRKNAATSEPICL